VVKDQDSLGMGFMTYKGLQCLIHGCLCRGCVAPSFAMHFFQANSLSILCFFHVLKDELKATILAWFLDNDSVTHKYLVEMGRLARDETPFLLVVQLRATTLAWWPNDGNVILLDTNDHYRSYHDETSYPPTNPLSIHYHLSL
jgi:hypothetical protein